MKRPLALAEILWLAVSLVSCGTPSPTAELTCRRVSQ